MSVATRRSGDMSIVRRHHPVGASTGYMDALRGDWEALVVEARKISAFTVELSALHEDELESLGDFMATRPALPFRYLGVHGPAKGRRIAEPALVESLMRVAMHADALVMHPDTIEDARHYQPLAGKLVLENMDARKLTGRTADEMATLFEALPEAGFCLDVAHAWSIDDSAAVAHGLLDAFGERLRHVHISSLSRDLQHETLSADDEVLFRPVLQRCLDVPWILEAPPRAA